MPRTLSAAWATSRTCQQKATSLDGVDCPENAAEQANSPGRRSSSTMSLSSLARFSLLGREIAKHIIHGGRSVKVSCASTAIRRAGRPPPTNAEAHHDLYFVKPRRQRVLRSLRRKGKRRQKLPRGLDPRGGRAAYLHSTRATAAVGPAQTPASYKRWRRNESRAKPRSGARAR